ncbi:Nif3-like dinuclear metal center hexameric protein [Spirosoma montaniterrae]|uniref:NGG1p interacting factor NIF3 n=1 Tax=Spirosoma montaniterrae TaxID=1178516 RepID=A0A1P9X3C2_9BACT|nr:Nif3-like dinuclear metal center hexameric protein [Spirosoma montaniterrae]AQG82136.1 hypothetical protein AWR27_24270 [Spirosoma montaniterrae]
MSNQTILPNDIAQFLRTQLSVQQYSATERGGIYRASNRPVARLGLALEPFPRLPQWLVDNQIDALWLHRPWHLDMNTIPANIGILHHHLPFDEHLTIGFNLRLAERLNAQTPPEPLGFKQATDEAGMLLPPRPIGMLLSVPEGEFDAHLYKARDEFKGYDRAEMGRHPTISRVAVVGAMTDALVREAANRGAQLYLTGQYRKPAQEAVNEVGIAVIALGHRRTEEWGLQALATLIQAQWPALTVMRH